MPLCHRHPSQNIASTNLTYGSRAQFPVVAKRTGFPDPWDRHCDVKPAFLPPETLSPFFRARQLLYLMDSNWNPRVQFSDRCVLYIPICWANVPGHQKLKDILSRSTILLLRVASSVRVCGWQWRELERVAKKRESWQTRTLFFVSHSLSRAFSWSLGEQRFMAWTTPASWLLWWFVMTVQGLSSSRWVGEWKKRSVANVNNHLSWILPPSSSLSQFPNYHPIHA